MLLTGYTPFYDIENLLRPFPTVEVSKEKEDYLISFELPGVGKENVKVEVTPFTVKVKGERTRGSPLKSEFYNGAFEREVKLPEEVIPTQSKASYTDGVLCVKIPKSSEKVFHPLLE